MNHHSKTHRHTPFNSIQSHKSGASCSTDSGSCGSCGGPGLCPGIAILIAYAVGGGVGLLTGINWLGWAVGSAVAIVLITGAWRFIPSRKSKS